MGSCEGVPQKLAPEICRVGLRERGREQLRCRYNTPSLQVMNNNYVDDTCGDSGVDDGWSTAFLAAQPYPSGGLGLILLILIILLLI